MTKKKILQSKIFLVLFTLILLLSTIVYAKPFTDAFKGGLSDINNFFTSEQYKPYAKAIDFFFFSLLFIAIYMMGVRYAFKEVKRPEQLIAILLGLMTAFLLVLGGFSATILLPYIHWLLYLLLFILFWWLLKGIKSKFWRFILALLLTLLTIALLQGLFGALAAPDVRGAEGFFKSLGDSFKGINFGGLVPGVPDYLRDLFGPTSAPTAPSLATLTPTTTPAAAAESKGWPWWIWPLIIIPLALGGFTLYRRLRGRQPPTTATAQQAALESIKSKITDIKNKKTESQKNINEIKEQKKRLLQIPANKAAFLTKLQELQRLSEPDAVTQVTNLFLNDTDINSEPAKPIIEEERKLMKELKNLSTIEIELHGLLDGWGTTILQNTQNVEDWIKQAIPTTINYLKELISKNDKQPNNDYGKGILWLTAFLYNHNKKQEIIDKNLNEVSNEGYIKQIVTEKFRVNIANEQQLNTYNGAENSIKDSLLEKIRLQIQELDKLKELISKIQTVLPTTQAAAQPAGAGAQQAAAQIVVVNLDQISREIDDYLSKKKGALINIYKIYKTKKVMNEEFIDLYHKAIHNVEAPFLIDPDSKPYQKLRDAREDIRTLITQELELEKHLAELLKIEFKLAGVNKKGGDAEKWWQLVMKNFAEPPSPELSSRKVEYRWGYNNLLKHISNLIDESHYANEAIQKYYTLTAMHIQSEKQIGKLLNPVELEGWIKEARLEKWNNIINMKTTRIRDFKIISDYMKRRNEKNRLPEAPNAKQAYVERLQALEDGTGTKMSELEFLKKILFPAINRERMRLKNIQWLIEYLKSNAEIKTSIQDLVVEPKEAKQEPGVNFRTPIRISTTVSQGIAPFKAYCYVYKYIKSLSEKTEYLSFRIGPKKVQYQEETLKQVYPERPNFSAKYPTKEHYNELREYYTVSVELKHKPIDNVFGTVEFTSEDFGDLPPGKYKVVIFVRGNVKADSPDEIKRYGWDKKEVDIFIKAGGAAPTPSEALPEMGEGVAPEALPTVEPIPEESETPPPSATQAQKVRGLYPPPAKLRINLISNVFEREKTLKQRARGIWHRIFSRKPPQVRRKAEETDQELKQAEGLLQKLQNLLEQLDRSPELEQQIITDIKALDEELNKISNSIKEKVFALFAEIPTQQLKEYWNNLLDLIRKTEEERRREIEKLIESYIGPVQPVETPTPSTRFKRDINLIKRITDQQTAKIEELAEALKIRRGEVTKAEQPIIEVGMIEVDYAVHQLKLFKSSEIDKLPEIKRLPLSRRLRFLKMNAVAYVKGYLKRLPEILGLAEEVEQLEFEFDRITGEPPVEVIDKSGVTDFDEWLDQREATANGFRVKRKEKKYEYIFYSTLSEINKITNIIERRIKSSENAELNKELINELLNKLNGSLRIADRNKEFDHLHVALVIIYELISITYDSKIPTPNILIKKYPYSRAKEKAVRERGREPFEVLPPDKNREDWQEYQKQQASREKGIDQRWAKLQEFRK